MWPKKSFRILFSTFGLAEQNKTMARMQLRDKQVDVIDGVHSFLETLLDIIERHVGTIMPGMIHLSHAQPMSTRHS
jgi:argininosuccinate lyase